MSEWKKVKLKDITISITDGKHGDCKDQDGSGYYFVSCKDVYDGDIHYENARQITKEDFEDTDRRTKLAPNDILITNSGTIGRMAFVKDKISTRKTTFQKSVAIVKPDSSKVFPLYLYYLLQNIVGEFINSANGAAQKNLLLSTMRDFDLDVLNSIPCQIRIATILSRYDTLIENYQKQIKLLEEAAQRLYKEWFVELRFPGHENTKMVDGLPEGWERKKLVEFGCSLESGARPKGGVDSNLKDGIPSVGAENVIGLGKYNYSSEKLVTNQFYSQMRKGKIKDRDILIYKDGAYIGRTSLFQDGFPHKEMAVNEHVFLLHTLNENYQYYVFFTLYQKQYFEKMQKLNKNAAQPGLNQKALLDLVMLCPSENFVLSFRKAIEPLMKALFSKANQIRLLTEARDRLLPRLMGGEMEVDAPKGQRAINPVHRSGYNPQTNHAPKGQKN